MDFIGKVAVHAITWGQDHHRALKEASELGYQAIEPWAAFALQYENREEQLLEELARFGLTITGLYGGASGELGRRFGDPTKKDDIIAYNIRLAKLLSRCGADSSYIVLGPGGPRENPSSLADIQVMADTINETAKRTLEYGVKSCVHPHLWTEIQDENELHALMELSGPEVYFAPDTAHLTGAGMDAASIISQYKDRVAYVHLKDLTPKEARVEDFPMLLGNEALPVFCELGLGTINFPPILEALVNIGYTGWLTVEIDQSTSTPYQSLQICRDFVEQKLGIAIRGN
ncbi:sugar phosphate isomerase/epimerase family protein [Paenibacillus mendelii]|uniref:Sugar phosphate isomerase/epimerase family protein n=1 Tax=Paenibacillus mendelii TaxID=206163 RepID=A0ABV6J7D9_9BACL|nr:sugar phosphate isomerase/epimerase [Paenibacillus mendelii]MCQ6562146.1 sugar phosphate isomerase/epimerase [Paenibacillus mendelii]